MSMFQKLFGRKPNASTEKSPIPSSVEHGSETIQRRPVFCDVCRRTVKAMINENGEFMTMVTCGDNPSECKTVDFIGSCVTCDIDACAGCAEWVIDNSVSSDPFVRRPACPRCGQFLVSKTRVDSKRIQQWLSSIMNDEIVDANALRRTIRIMNDESMNLIPGIGRETFENILQSLMNLQSELEKSKKN